MKYKRIITSGCSFSDLGSPWSWVLQLENHIKREYPNVTFDHRGLRSQGQELIQKKAVHAICEAMDQGYKPEEIAVFVMWSSSDRKAHYINNPQFIHDIVENWKVSKQGWGLQFGDLKNTTDGQLSLITQSENGNSEICYQKDGGWFITSLHTTDGLKMFRDIYLMGAGINNSVPLASIHTSIENMIMLQSFCKSLGVKLYQQMFMNIVWRDFERTKNHQIISYLYKQLDKSTFILPDSSMHEFLKGNELHFKSPTDPHPSGLGHRIWLTDVIIPHLVDDGFFD